MRKVFPVLVFLLLGGAIYGQDSNLGGAQAQTVSENWSKLGPTVEGPRGFSLQGRGIRINGAGQYELWVKIVPVNQESFVRRYGLSREVRYVHQYAIVDCEKKYLSLERTTAFDASDRALKARTDSLTPGSKRNKVQAGSIGESIFKYVCEDPTSLPMTKN